MKQIEKTEDPETETVATDNQGTEIMMMTWGGSVDGESSPDPPPSQCRGLSDLPQDMVDGGKGEADKRGEDRAPRQGGRAINREPRNRNPAT